MKSPPESNWLRFGLGLCSLGAAGVCFGLARSPKEYEFLEFAFIHLLMVAWVILFLRTIRLSVVGRPVERFGQGPVVVLIVLATVLLVVAFRFQRRALECFENNVLWKWAGAMAGFILLGGLWFSMVGLLRNRK